MSLKSVEESNYNEEKVLEYFMHLTRNLEGIGGSIPSMGCVGMMIEFIEDEKMSRKDAFNKALAQLKEFTPIGDDSE